MPVSWTESLIVRKNEADYFLNFGVIRALLPSQTKYQTHVCKVFYVNLMHCMKNFNHESQVLLKEHMLAVERRRFIIIIYI